MWPSTPHPLKGGVHCILVGNAQVRTDFFRGFRREEVSFAPLCLREGFRASSPPFPHHGRPLPGVVHHERWR